MSKCCLSGFFQKSSFPKERDCQKNRHFCHLRSICISFQTACFPAFCQNRDFLRIPAVTNHRHQEYVRQCGQCKSRPHWRIFFVPKPAQCCGAQNHAAGTKTPRGFLRGCRGGCCFVVWRRSLIPDPASFAAGGQFLRKAPAPTGRKEPPSRHWQSGAQYRPATASRRCSQAPRCSAGRLNI